MRRCMHEPKIFYLKFGVLKSLKWFYIEVTTPWYQKHIKLYVFLYKASFILVKFTSQGQRLKVHVYYMKDTHTQARKWLYIELHHIWWTISFCHIIKLLQHISVTLTYMYLKINYSPLLLISTLQSTSFCRLPSAEEPYHQLSLVFVVILSLFSVLCSSATVNHSC